MRRNGRVLSFPGDRLNLPVLDYWVVAVGRQFWRYELASETLPEKWGPWAA